MWEELLAKINKLKNSGGVGWDEPGKTLWKTELTLDGGILGAQLDRGIGLEVGKTYIIKTAKAEYTYTAESFEGMTVLGNPPGTNNAEAFVFQQGDGDTAITTAMAFDGSTNLEVRTTETIHPISDKYLPGVCLPVVELSTAIVATDDVETYFTAEENAKLDKATASGTPFIASMTVQYSNNFIPLTMVLGIFAGQYFAILGSSTAVFLKKDDGWKASVEPI